MLVRNVSPRGPMCFRWLMFNLSGPCELLFFFVLLLIIIIIVLSQISNKFSGL